MIPRKSRAREDRLIRGAPDKGDVIAQNAHSAARIGPYERVAGRGDVLIVGDAKAILGPGMASL